MRLSILGNAAIVFGLVLCGARAAGAQSLEQRCTAAGGTAATCAAGMDASEIVSARALLVAGAGNPVPGTASTLGFRVPGTPRIGLTARLTAGSIETPSPDAPARTESSTVIGLNADIAVGVFDGVRAVSTVGGIGSVDLVGSLGILRMPSDWSQRSPVTWALGARFGVVRESFNVPGISVTAMYRRLGETGPGSSMDSWNASLSGLSSWTMTGVIGKRVGLLGFAAGAAWSHRSGHARLTASDAGAQSVTVPEGPIGGSRVHGFVDVTWTATVLSLSGELGWQASGNALTRGRAPASDAPAGGPFFGVAARLTI